MKKRIGIDVDSKLWKEVKSEAVKKEISLMNYLSEILQKREK